MYLSIAHGQSRKDAKDSYFGMLGYDIWIYAKHSKELSRKKTHDKLTGPMKMKAVYIMLRPLEYSRYLVTRRPLALSRWRRTCTDY